MDDARKTRAELIQEVTALRQRLAHLDAERMTPTAAHVQEACVHEIRLRAVLQTTVDGIITIDVQGRIESFNPAAERLFGYRADEVIGHNVAMLMPSPYREAYDGYLARYLQTGERKIIGIGREVQGQHRDGSIFPIDLAVSEERLGGRRVFTGIVRDITERQQTAGALREREHQLQLLTDALPVLIAYMDTEQRYRLNNRTYETWFGRPQSAVYGQHMKDVLGVHAYEAIRPHIEAALSGQTVTFESTVPYQQGGTRHVQATYVPNRDEAGHVQGFFALVSDITERQRTETALRRTEHLALLGRLAAGVSHELRNPLSAISLSMELMQEELQQPSPDSQTQLAEAMAQIRTELTRMHELVQDYLSLARLTSVQREQADLGAFVKACAQEMEARVASHGITLSLYGLGSLGEVAFHPNTLRCALANLMQNALEAMPQGGSLTVWGQRAVSHVHLHISDTGVGITEDERPLIFEPLHTTKPDGTGLGLYLVREIVAAHEGRIEVNSVPGQGTTFTLTLPRAAEGPNPPNPSDR